MADEIRIENVGGDNGVASEVTLIRLVETMEKMAASSGADPKSQAAKAEKARTDSIKQGIKVSTKHRDAVKDNTDALKDNTKYLKMMGGGLLRLGALLTGAAYESISNFGKELLGTSRELSSFAQHLPVLGGHISFLTGLFDESFNTFQDLAKSGATFGYSLTELRGAASDARMSLDEFSGFVQNNTQRFAAFGGTVDQGIRNVTRLRDVMGDDLTNRFRQLGITGEEINEQLTMQLYLNRAGSRTRRTTDAQYLASTLDLTKNMATLAKLTGEDVKSQQEKIAQAQMDVAFQRELNRLDEDERKKVNAALAEAMAAGGPAAVEVLKAQFLGMPPLTEAAQLYTATQSEGAELIRQNLDNALNSAIEYDDYMLQRESRMADYGEAYANAAQRLDTILRAEAAGLEGIGIAEQMLQSQTTFGTYIDETGRFVRDEFTRLFQGLSDEGPDDEDDGGLSAMAAFRTAVDNARDAINDNLIVPLQTLLTGPLTDFTTWFSSFTADETGEGSKLEKALQGLTDFINDPLMPAITGFFEAFAEDPAQAIKDAFAGMADAFADWFLGPNTRDIMGGPGGEYVVGEEEIKREGGFFDRELRPIFTTLFGDATSAIIEGVSSWWEENGSVSLALTAAAAALFAAGGPIAGAFVSGIGTMLASRAVANAFSRGISRATPVPGTTTPPRTTTPPSTTGATVGRDPQTGRFTRLPNAPEPNRNILSGLGRTIKGGAKFIPGVGWLIGAGLGTYDATQGFNADPDADFSQRLENAFDSFINGLTFGLAGTSASDIAANAAEPLTQADIEEYNRLTEAISGLEEQRDGAKNRRERRTINAQLRALERQLEDLESRGAAEGIPQTPTNSLPDTSALEPEETTTAAPTTPAVTELTEAERQQIENLRSMLSSQEGVVRELQRLNTTNENMQALQDETREYLKRILRETEQ